MTIQEILQGVHDWTNGKIVYDISVAHPDGQGNPTPYTDLTAALGTNGVNIPESLRKGGMSIKFVQSSDNKYVQYRLMSDTFNTTVANWQGVDDEPTAGSKNLVKSGGVDSIFASNKELTWSDGYISSTGVCTTSTVSKYSQPFILHKGEKITVKTASNHVAIVSTALAVSVAINDRITPIIVSPISDDYSTYTYQAQEDIPIVLCFKKEGSEVYISYSEVLTKRLDGIEGSLDMLDSDLNTEIGAIKEQLSNIEAKQISETSSLQIKGINGQIFSGNKYNRVYHTPVSKGDYIRFYIKFPTSRYILYGVYSEISTGQKPLSNFFYQGSISEYEAIINIKEDGYFAWAEYAGPNTGSVGRSVSVVSNFIDIKTFFSKSELDRTFVNGYRITDGGIWQNTGICTSYFYSITNQLKIEVICSGYVSIAFLKSDNHLQSTAPDYCNGESAPHILYSGTTTLTIPHDCNVIVQSILKGNNNLSSIKALPIIDSIQEEVAANSEDIEEIKSEVFPSNTIHDYNADEEQRVISLGKDWRSNNQRKRFVFAQMSDSHSESVIKTKRFSDWANTFMGQHLDLLIHTGDVQYLEYDDSQWVGFEAIRSASSIPFLLALGNHDQCDKDGNGTLQQGGELSLIYNKYISPMVQQGLITAEPNQTYYKYDITDKKIRLIVLNDFDPIYNGFYSESGHTINYYKRRYSPEQCNWFINTLSTLETGWTAIVAKHGVDNMVKTDRNWSVTRNEELPDPHKEGDDIVVNSFAMDSHPIMDIINAYQNKTTLSKTYNYTDNSIAAHYPNGFTLSANFSSAVGTFGFIVEGHAHFDFIAHDYTYPNIKIIVCANSGHFQYSYQMDMGRTNDYGKAQDCINVYAVDTKNRRVWVVRVGANYTLDGKTRSVTYVDY